MRLCTQLSQTEDHESGAEALGGWTRGRGGECDSRLTRATAPPLIPSHYAFHKFDSVCEESVSHFILSRNFPQLRVSDIGTHKGQTAPEAHSGTFTCLLEKADNAVTASQPSIFLNCFTLNWCPRAPYPSTQRAKTVTLNQPVLY